MNRKNRKYQYADLKVYVLGNPYFEEHLHRRRYAHHFTILLVAYGTIRLQVNEEVQLITGKTLLVIPSKNFYSILGMEAQGLVYIVSFPLGFAFKNNIKRPQMRLFGFLMMPFSKEVVLTHKETALLSNLIGLLVLGMQKPDTTLFKERIIGFKFNVLLYEIIGIYYNQAPHFRIRATKKMQLVIRFFDLLSKHFKKQHGVQFYATHLAVTPEHLSKTLKQITGKTSKQHINGFIIEEATFLLQNNLTIKNICKRLHFGTPRSFGRFFKRQTAVSPLAYRRKMTSI